MLVGWGVLSPVSKQFGWAPGPVGDMASGARGWILWVSLAIMCTDSLVSLLPVAVEYFATLLPTRMHHALYGQISSNPDKEEYECETEDRLVPNSWVVSGACGSVVIGTILVWTV